MNNLIWLESWYQSQCNGDWEHIYGIKIETLDNPGWFLTIETKDSLNELSDFDWIDNTMGDNDWYFYRVIGKVFEAHGDPSKLYMLISVFRDLITAVV